jgi:hypothetical protein
MFCSALLLPANVSKSPQAYPLLPEYFKPETEQHAMLRHSSSAEHDFGARLSAQAIRIGAGSVDQASQPYASAKGGGKGITDYANVLVAFATEPS